jgi:hypothetical protein
MKRNSIDGTTIHDLQNRNGDQRYDKEPIDIEELAKDISDNLNDKEPFESEEIEKENESNLTLSVPHNLKEPLILLIIYVIMSQSFVRELLGKYITILNPNEEGVVPIVGIIIYGIILVGLFMFVKKLL